MIRLFIALDLPEALRLRLAGLQRPLPRTRWVQPENMHVTLRFVGEVPRGAADDLHEMLSRVSMPAFDMTIAGIGSFGSKGRIRAVWAGVEKSAGLVRLRGKLETACQRAGQPPERRKFHPHVTLARCRDIRDDQAHDFLYGNDGLFGGTVRIGEFVLYSSRLGHDGSVYTAEARYPLDGGGYDAPANDDRFAELAAEWADD
jgi:2'-5' RNA ligase